MNSITIIDLLRHGEPVGGKRYRGQTDDPLSDRGWQEMRKATSGTVLWNRVISSPLARCREFAEEYTSRHGLPLTLDDRLKEIGFGDWEGKTADQLRAEDPLSLRRFYADPLGNQPRGAEPPVLMMDRVQMALSEVVEDAAGERLLVIAHAGVIRAVVGHLLGISPGHLFRIRVDTAHFTQVRFGGERPPIVAFQNRPGPLL